MDMNFIFIHSCHSICMRHYIIRLFRTIDGIRIHMCQYNMFDQLYIIESLKGNIQ